MEIAPEIEGAWGWGFLRKVFFKEGMFGVAHVVESELLLRGARVFDPLIVVGTAHLRFPQEIDS